MSVLLQDLRYGVRTVARSPAFAAAAVLTLALGIGANTAVFSLIDAALLRPLPFPQPERLVVLQRTYPPPRPGRQKFYMDFTDWHAQRTIFEQVAAYSSGGLNLMGQDTPVRVRASQVTTNFFTTLGIQPAAGRAFRDEEGTRDRAQVVILSDGLWRRQFGGHPGIIGQTITLHDRPFLVVGIMPAGFTFPHQTELWIPYLIPPDITWHSDMQSRTQLTTVALGRLRQDLSVGEAQARAGAVEQAFRQDHPSEVAWDHVRIVSLRDELLGGAARGLLVVLGAVGLILILACTNVAGLLLGRATTRQHEIALRAALGARRSRVVRQLLTESGLLALGGATVGLLLAWIGKRTLGAMVPARLVDLSPLTLDFRVLGFALLLAVVSTLFFGLAPAMILSESDVHAALREGGYRAPTRRLRGLQRAIVTVEIGLAVVLLIATGLMLKSLTQLQGAELGLQREKVLTLNVSLPRASYASRQRRAAFYREALGRLEGIPGVAAAGAVNILPLTEGSAGFSFQVVGRPPFPPADRPRAEYLVASPDYFRSIGIPLLRGPGLDADDDSTAPRTVVISELMARRFWPGQDPIGSRLMLPGDTTQYSVVGVVGNVRSVRVEEESHWQGQMYVSYQQAAPYFMTFTLRASIDPAQMVNAARQAVAEVDPTLPLFDLRTMEEVVSVAIAPQRLTALSVALAGALALILATVGVYGAMSQAVGQRTHEIGIRMALGAMQPEVLRLVWQQGLLQIAAGVAVGLAGAWAATRVLRHLLYQVSVTDVAVYVSAPAFVAAVALMACYPPVRRATRVDPVVTLRYE